MDRGNADRQNSRVESMMLAKNIAHTPKPSMEELMQAHVKRTEMLQSQI